jgi:hypothetical protein
MSPQPLHFAEPRATLTAMTTTWQDAEAAGLITLTERQRRILDEVEPAPVALKGAREFSADDTAPSVTELQKRG